MRAPRLSERSEESRRAKLLIWVGVLACIGTVLICIGDILACIGAVLACSGTVFACIGTVLACIGTVSDCIGIIFDCFGTGLDPATLRWEADLLTTRLPRYLNYVNF